MRIEEVCRVDGDGAAADRKVQVVADGALQQGGIAHLADLLPGLYLVPGLDGNVRVQTGIAGGVAALVADHPGHAHGFVIVDREHLPGRGGADLRACLGGNVNADFDTLQEVAAWIQNDTTGSTDTGSTDTGSTDTEPSPPPVTEDPFA